MNSFAKTFGSAASIAEHNTVIGIELMWSLVSTRRERIGSFAQAEIDKLAPLVPWGKLSNSCDAAVSLFGFFKDANVFRPRQGARQLLHSGLLCAVRCGLFAEACEILMLGYGEQKFQLSLNQEAFAHYAAENAVRFFDAHRYFRMPRKFDTSVVARNTMAFLFSDPRHMMSAKYATALLRLSTLGDEGLIVHGRRHTDTSNAFDASAVELMAHFSKLVSFDVVAKWLQCEYVQKTLYSALFVDKLGGHARSWKTFCALPIGGPVLNNGPEPTAIDDPRCVARASLVACVAGTIHESKTWDHRIFAPTLDERSGQWHSTTACRRFNAFRVRNARVMQLLLRAYWEFAFLCFSWRPTPACLPATLVINIVDKAALAALCGECFIDGESKMKIAQSARDAYVKLCDARASRQTSRKRKRAGSL